MGGEGAFGCEYIFNFSGSSFAAGQLRRFCFGRFGSQFLKAQALPEASPIKRLCWESAEIYLQMVFEPFR